MLSTSELPFITYLKYCGNRFNEQTKHTYKKIDQ